jgi:type III secretion system FlhB-like substrate exporter
MILFDGDDERKVVNKTLDNKQENEEKIKIELYKEIPNEAYRLIEEILRYVGALEKKSNIE